VNKVARIFSGKNIFSTTPTSKHADVVFPNPEYYYFKNMASRIFWIPDFQEDHLPHLFTAEEIEARKNGQRRIAEEAPFLVLSSRSSKEDFDRLYPGSGTNVFVLNFAVVHPEFKSTDVSVLLRKYGLPEKYFFSPNQFWTHKNHIVILKAIGELKKRGMEVMVAFSGKEDDYRDPHYTQRLKDYVNENGLNDQVRFLGFLDRREQLQLMNHAVAVIQPSLFEGWSTVVEDAKAMGQIVIASDLNVHREQLGSWEGTSVFFKPDDFQELAGKMSDVLNGKLLRVDVDYLPNIRKYAQDFMNMVMEVSLK
jgi:glycosyltransferase involved in cell wall biosynthesis